MLDAEALAAMLAPIISEEVEKAVTPLNARIAELEARKPDPGPAGEKGQQGEPGADGVSPEPEAVIEACKDTLGQTIKEMLDFAMSELPASKPGPPGEKGERGDPGADGQNGADGRGVKELLIGREGQLVATMDDGEMKDLGVIIGKDGRDGTDGKDGEQGDPGFSLDDFDIERGDDGRTFTLKFERGDTRHSYEMTFPAPVYCGVYKEAEQYVPGDLVTWGGSLWHCDAETKDKPGTDSWTLAVKKGRDGKDAKPNG